MVMKKKCLESFFFQTKYIGEISKKGILFTKTKVFEETYLETLFKYNTFREISMLQLSTKYN